jgi:hypothetical protein
MSPTVPARFASEISLIFLLSSGPCQAAEQQYQQLLLELSDLAAQNGRCAQAWRASLRSMYRRRETLYEHQRWARDRLGMRNCDEEELAALEAQLRLQANDAASVGELVKGAER